MFNSNTDQFWRWAFHLKQQVCFPLHLVCGVFPNISGCSSDYQHLQFFFFFASWCTWWLHFQEHFLSSEYYPPLCPEHECTPYYRLAITNTCPCFTHMVVTSGPLTQRDRMIQHSDNLWNLLCTCYSQALLYTLGSLYNKHSVMLSLGNTTQYLPGFPITWDQRDHPFVVRLHLNFPATVHPHSLHLDFHPLNILHLHWKTPKSLPLAGGHTTNSW